MLFEAYFHRSTYFMHETSENLVIMSKIRGGKRPTKGEKSENS